MALLSVVAPRVTPVILGVFTLPLLAGHPLKQHPLWEGALQLHPHTFMMNEQFFFSTVEFRQNPTSLILPAAV